MNNDLVESNYPLTNVKEYRSMKTIFFQLYDLFNNFERGAFTVQYLDLTLNKLLVKFNNISPEFSKQLKSLYCYSSFQLKTDCGCDKCEVKE